MQAELIPNPSFMLPEAARGISIRKEYSKSPQKRDNLLLKICDTIFLVLIREWDKFHRIGQY